MFQDIAYNVYCKNAIWLLVMQPGLPGLVMRYSVGMATFKYINKHAVTIPTKYPIGK